jgi:Tol biopolymer transport system component
VLVYARPVTASPFERREIVYRAAPDGADPVPLASGTSPLVSPDGREVAYAAGTLQDQGRLSVIGTAGGAVRSAPISAAPLVWAWSSRELVASSVSGAVYLVRLPSLSVRRLRMVQPSDTISFSPDGTTLAFDRGSGHGGGPDIYTYALASGAVHRLTRDGRSAFPSWGPRGLGFERFGPGRCCHGDVWLMNGSGGGARQVTHTRAGIYPAAWSADGDRLLAAYPATNNGRLYAVDVRTGAARAITPWVGDLGGYGLSRDGRVVLAAVGCGEVASVQGVVETIPFSGGAPTVIARGPCRASWSGGAP